MTVSTINGVQAELRRAQENQNKPNTALPYQPSAARLPEDVITIPADSGVDVATAVQQTVVQNRDAASSVLNDADIAELVAAKGTSSEQVQMQAKAAIAAQTGKLPANILNLLVE